MKWREPWLQSLKLQEPFRPFGRRVVRGFLVWSAVFAMLVGIAAFGKENPLAHAMTTAWLIPAGGAVMSLVLYAVWWLSPRTINSGPRGIVVSKADEISLIPWSAIASYEISNAGEGGRLRIILSSGEEHVLMLPRSARNDEIEAELREMMSKPRERDRPD